MGEFSGRIRQGLKELLPVAAQDRLDRIPGLDQTTIENVIAEIGVGNIAGSGVGSSQQYARKRP